MKNNSALPSPTIVSRSKGWGLGWCREGESNPQGTKYRRILSPLRLPVPPSRLENFKIFYTKEIGQLFHCSIRPDSAVASPSVAVLVAVARMSAAPCSIFSAAIDRSFNAWML